MIRRLPRVVAALFTLFALGSLVAGQALAASGNLAAVRAATARFHSTAEAGAAGYGPFPAGVPLHQCISNLSGPGAMGVHWLNPNLLDDRADPLHPEVLVYAPDKGGKLKLVALEYVVFQSAWFEHHAANTRPELFGMEFMDTGSPNRYAIPAFFSLHVWLYRDNPDGLFEPFNVNVSCGDTAAARGAGASLAAASVGRFACRLETRSA